MRLTDIPSYTAADWAAERAAAQLGAPLACPNCGRTDDYHPFGIPPADGSQRKYRGCKMCGCWQEADGQTRAYCCVLTAHSCVRAIPQNAQCANCHDWGPREQHRCRRVLTAPELGRFVCKQCGVNVTTAHVIAWPVAAD